MRFDLSALEDDEFGRSGSASGATDDTLTALRSLGDEVDDSSESDDELTNVPLPSPAVMAKDNVVKFQFRPGGSTKWLRLVMGQFTLEFKAEDQPFFQPRPVWDKRLKTTGLFEELRDE